MVASGEFEGKEIRFYCFHTHISFEQEKTRPAIVTYPGVRIHVKVSYGLTGLRFKFLVKNQMYSNESTVFCELT